MAENISRVFDNGVLKPTARAEKRAAILAGETNHMQGTLHICIRAAGNAPKGVVIREDSFDLRTQGGGMQPNGYEVAMETRGGNG